MTSIGELAWRDRTNVAPRPLRAGSSLAEIINAIHDEILIAAGLSALVLEVLGHRALSNVVNRKGRSDEMDYVHFHLHR